MPKDRENKRIGKAGKKLNPNNVEIRDKPISTLQIPRMIADPIAIVLILKLKSVLNLRIKFLKNCKDYSPLLQYRHIYGKNLIYCCLVTDHGF